MEKRGVGRGRGMKGGGDNLPAGENYSICHVRCHFPHLPLVVIGLLVITKFKLLKMVLCRVAPYLFTRACFLSHTVSLALFISFPFSYFFLPFLLMFVTLLLNR